VFTVPLQRRLDVAGGEAVELMRAAAVAGAQQLRRVGHELREVRGMGRAHLRPLGQRLGAMPRLFAHRVGQHEAPWRSGPGADMPTEQMPVEQRAQQGLQRAGLEERPQHRLHVVGAELGREHRHHGQQLRFVRRQQRHAPADGGLQAGVLRIVVRRGRADQQLQRRLQGRRQIRQRDAGELRRRQLDGQCVAAQALADTTDQRLVLRAREVGTGARRRLHEQVDRRLRRAHRQRLQSIQALDA
jgi:hypothetical protein